MTTDQPRADAIAAHIDNLIRNYTEDRSLTRDDVLRDLDQLRHVAALAPADPTADPRAALAGHPSPDRGSGPWVLRPPSGSRCPVVRCTACSAVRSTGRP